VPGAILIAILSGELPVVKTWARLVDDHRSRLLPLTIGMAVVGFLLLVQGWARLLRSSDRPMSHEEVATLMAPRKQFSVRRIRGRTTGVQADEGPDAAWTFRDMKIAWRSGAWWRDPAWRSHFAFVIAVAIGYAVTRTTVAFWRA
jgi:hypothetical protein